MRMVAENDEWRRKPSFARAECGFSGIRRRPQSVTGRLQMFKSSVTRDAYVIQSLGFRAFISFRSVANRPLKKLIEQTQEFHGPVHFQRSLQKTVLLDEIPNVLFGQHNGPAEIRKRNILRGPQSADLTIPPLDVRLSLGKEPFTQMPKDFR